MIIPIVRSFQIACLQKQKESGTKLTAELTEDREAERVEFEREMEAMRNEIDQVRDSAKTEALLMQKVDGNLLVIICFVIIQCLI